jgi:hypothetical protein
MMVTTVVATRQSAWECKWSRPGFRLAGLEEPMQPETVWICVRTGERRRLSETTCDQCPFWRADEFRKN